MVKWFPQLWHWIDTRVLQTRALLRDCRELAADDNRLQKLLHVFNIKHISIHAPYTGTVLFRHISDIPQWFRRVKLVIIPHVLHSSSICEILFYNRQLVVITYQLIVPQLSSMLGYVYFSVVIAFQLWSHGRLSRYVKLWVAHAPGMPATFSLPPGIHDPGMHHGTCVTHVPWCMPGPLTSGFLWSRWRGKRFRYFWRMCNLQFYVSDKRPMRPCAPAFWHFHSLLA